MGLFLAGLIREHAASGRLDLSLVGPRAEEGPSSNGLEGPLLSSPEIRDNNHSPAVKTQRAPRWKVLYPGCVIGSGPGV